jgi:hypothetical protein
MGRAQRFALLGIAAAIALAAVIVIGTGGGGGGDDDVTTSAVVETPTPRAADTPAPTTDDRPAAATTPAATPRPSIPVMSAAKPRRVVVRQGQTVRFAVRSDIDEEIHLHGYDRAKPIKAGGRVVMTLKADLTGRFEVELENSGAPVGELEVRP